MIKVLHCIHSLSGGGAERQLNMLANISRNANILSGIFCVNDKGNDIKDTDVKIYKSKKSNKYNVSIFPSLNEAIDDFKPNIVHVWLPESITIPSMLTAYIRGVPCVFSYRNFMFFNRPLAILEFILSLIISSRIVSNNPIEQSTYLYRKLYYLKNGVVIPNAVRLESKFRKSINRPITGQIKKMLFVGRITRQKNWECLLRALPFIKSCHKWELCICGDGEDYPNMIKLAEKLNICDKLKLMGHCKDVYSIMHCSDLLIHPSWYEGMSNVVMEALEIGLPCIVSDIPAHVKFNENETCVLTFSPFSHLDLARVVNKYFDDELVGQSLVRSGWSVVKEYSLERAINRYYQFYSSMHCT